MHDVDCVCEHCWVKAPLLWAIDAALPVLALRDDGEQPFEPEELAIAAALAAAFAVVSISVLQSMKDSLARADLREVEAAFAQADALMGGVVNADLIKTVQAEIGIALKNGALDATTGATPSLRRSLRPRGVENPLAGSDLAEQVARHSVASVEFYAANYWPTKLQPALRSKIDQIIAASSATDALPVEDLAKAFDHQFSKSGYWRMVANAAVSRTYHYGLLKAGQRAGRTAYTWVSVVDNATSEVCLAMSGQQLWVADAVSLMERMASTDDPTAATKLMPWLSGDDAEGASATELRDAGLLAPPAHPHCRSTLVMS